MARWSLYGFAVASLLVWAGLRTSTPVEATTLADANMAALGFTPSSTDARIRRCPRGRVDNYLSPRMQQCWFDGPHGRWRTLRHELHYYSLVVEVEAASLADAAEIARRFIKLHGERFSEVMLYVQEEAAPDTSTIRRIQWTRSAGFETLEFEGSLRR